MCGRYTLAKPTPVIATAFHVDVPDWEPRYNIAPTQQVLIVSAAGVRSCSLARWGLVPSWATSLKEGPPLINARAETADRLPAFRSAFRKRRCLVPADGFFEWKTEGKVKRPHHFTLKNGNLFAFAGLWERREGELSLTSVTILTTEANDLVRPCHDRMPVILAPEAYDRWLDPGSEVGDLLVTFPAARMSVRAVSKAVGNPRNEGPQCLAPAELSQTAFF